MNRYKICVYAICKNEENFVSQWMDSMQEADCVVVTDTGSTDETVERLKSRGAVVYTERINPWRFDLARNLSLKHVPEDTDICVCTDLDETFVPGWRALLEAAWQQDTKKAKYLYNWSLKPDGTPDVQMVYSKVHARNGYKWMWPVHEYLVYSGKAPEKAVFIEEMVLNHYPDVKKSRGSYLPLLELAAKEDPESERMAYYLGREYMYKGMWGKCIETLERYLKLKTALWKEERCAAMRWIAHSCHKSGRNAEAFIWYHRAIAEAPHMRDPYVECAQMAYELANWPMVFYMTQEALKIKERSNVFVNSGSSWDHTPDDLCAIACYRLGMYGKALEHAKTALSFLPDDERLKNNLKLIETKLMET
ncbi:MAG TPA: glycosyltransferase [Anaerovoracaceae bacterium]|nr:glycosyltransferase [Anaerovoracaceae bacterium]